MKVCQECREEKPLSEFNKDRSKRDGIYSYCKVCHTARAREYGRKNKAEIKKRTQAYREANRHKWDIQDRTRKYRHKYDITLQDYDVLFDMQGGRCAICGRHQSVFQKRLAVDHNHDTGLIRGLLCDKCNRALGLFCDSIELLESAAGYLRQYRGQE